MFGSRYMPCPHCGASVDRNRVDAAHECAPERLADYQMFALRDEIANLEASYLAYLDTFYGRFEVWLASEQVRGRR